jgi:hypothetical protein
MGGLRQHHCHLGPYCISPLPKDQSSRPVSTKLILFQAECWARTGAFARIEDRSGHWQRPLIQAILFYSENCRSPPAARLRDAALEPPVQQLARRVRSRSRSDKQKRGDARERSARHWLGHGIHRQLAARTVRCVVLLRQRLYAARGPAVVHHLMRRDGSSPPASAQLSQPQPATAQRREHPVRFEKMRQMDAPVITHQPDFNFSSAYSDSSIIRSSS